MNRWERLLLLFSVAMNIAFVSIAVTHHVLGRGHRESFDVSDAPVVMREGPGSVVILEGKHARRRAVLDHTLRLGPEQGLAFDAGFRRVRPYLRDAHHDVIVERFSYAQALERGDAPLARESARRLSQAQARIDSLVAEAMLQETSVLSPDQRSRYVMWTFRPEASPRRSFDVPHPSE